MAKIGFYAYPCRLSLYISLCGSVRRNYCAVLTAHLSFSFFSSASTSSRFF